jgi:hypothetical protein
MALLKCRHCETEIDSNARKTRCPGCGQLFPFACAVCEAPLRPPFPVFDDERYINDDNEPLCPEHFQRQCPNAKHGSRRMKIRAISFAKIAWQEMNLP